MTVTVAGSLDATVVVQRRTPSPDGYGHTTEVWNTISAMTPCNIFKPTASLLQQYALIIGSQAALMLRVMPTTDIREGDSVVVGSYGMRAFSQPFLFGYSGHFQAGSRWLVQNIQNAESYTIGIEALITLIT
jgi:hypothetical protein